MNLSNNELQLLEAAKRHNGGFHLATEWYLRGWVPLDYQYVWHHVPVLNTTVVAGVGAGKTAMVTASNIIDCLTYPGFRALNASVTAKQAELSFQMLESWRDSNPRLEKHISDTSLRPYPIVSFTNGSVFEFRTAGQDAKFIRGSEYDRINYDEPQLDMVGEAVRVLRGRLRGRRPDGSPRMARLDCTGTPSAAPWLRERFYKGIRGHETATKEKLQYYWSMRVETYDNKMLTPDQIKAIEQDYPQELIDIELRGMFPDYGVSMFPLDHVTECTDPSLNDEMEEFRETKSSGYNLVEWPRVGEILFETPARNNSLYVIAGDPGVDTPPRRNAGVVIVADVTSKPYTIVYFNWVPGKGSYHPFMDSYKYAVRKYKPVAKGIDSTGPQKALDELGFQDFGLLLDNMNFGPLKDAMLNSLLVDVVNHAFRWPRIQGLIQQMSTYTRENDKKLAQDIVMTLAMVSWLSRSIKSDYREDGEVKANYANRKQRSAGGLRARR
jgi:hypothetical protein